jgi:hypothetical protein
VRHVEILILTINCVFANELVITEDTVQMSANRDIDGVCEEIEAVIAPVFDRQSLRERGHRVFRLFGTITESNLAAKLRECRGHTDKVDEALACCMFGIKKHFAHVPRPTQVVGAILFLTKSADQGRLLEQKTGEGKSDTIAMTAGKVASVAYSNRCV